MKARIKATGEIVTLNENDISLLDYARNIYKDVNGNKYKGKELEFLQDDHADIDWEQRRYEIAKTVVHGQLTGSIIDGVDPNPSVEDLAKWSVRIADALISELKKEEFK